MKQRRTVRLWLLWSAVAIAAVSACAQIVWAFDGWPSLTTHLRDDAYHGFTWAVHFGRSQGPVVSERVWTSGVQPLWCLLLAWLGNGQPLAIADVAIVLGIACHALGAASFAIAGRGQPAAWCTALLWLGNPLLLSECQNGQETALAAFCAALLWHGRRARPRTFLVLSLVAVFARSDLWLCVLGLSLARRHRRRIDALAVPGIVLAVHVAWNLALGGGVLPDSALPMAWLAQSNFAALEPSFREVVQKVWWFLRPVLLGGPFALAGAPALAALVWLLLRPRCPKGVHLVPALLVGGGLFADIDDLLVPGIAAVLLLLWPARQKTRMPRDLAWFAVAMVGIVALHWAVRWYPRDYYAAPLAVAGSAALLRLWRWPVVLAAVAAAQLGLGLAFPLGREPLQHQRAMQVAGVALPVLLPGGERVGCFNSGIVGFERLAARAGAPPVVNLDGRVDWRAFAALRQGALQAFLDAQSVRFVVDHPVQFEADPALPHACGRWFGGGFLAERDLLPLVRCVEPGVDAGRPATSAFVLYWRRGRGDQPELPAQPSVLGGLGDGSPVVFWPAGPGVELVHERSLGARATVLHCDAGAAYALALSPDDGAGQLIGGDARLVLPGRQR